MIDRRLLIASGIVIWLIGMVNNNHPYDFICCFIGGFIVGYGLVQDDN